MDSEHTLALIPDYALGLLAAEERRRVEAHARRCPACRAALQREQRVGGLVRDAVQTVAPPPGRLAALRPALPTARSRPAPLSAQLAPLTLAAAMLVMGLLFASGRLPHTPALFAASQTPTQTATVASTTTGHPPTATLAAAVTAPDGSSRAATPLALALPPAPPAMTTPRP